MGRLIFMRSGALFIIAFVTLTPQAWAKGGGGKSTNNLVWFGGAAGNVTAIKPKHEIDFGSLLLFVVGGEVSVFKSPLAFTFSFARGIVISSEMQYDYTAPGSNNNYRVNAQHFNSDVNYLGVGAKFRFVNSSWLKLYGEYGGIVGHHKYNYDEITLNNIHPADDYKKSNDRVFTAGTYYEAGIDLIPFTAGIRLAARYAKHYTSAIPELAGRKITYEEVYGYLAVVAGF